MSWRTHKNHEHLRGGVWSIDAMSCILTRWPFQMFNPPAQPTFNTKGWLSRNPEGQTYPQTHVSTCIRGRAKQCLAFSFCFRLKRRKNEKRTTKQKTVFRTRTLRKQNGIESHRTKRHRKRNACHEAHCRAANAEDRRITRNVFVMAKTKHTTERTQSSRAENKRRTKRIPKRSQTAERFKLF